MYLCTSKASKVSTWRVARAPAAAANAAGPPAYEVAYVRIRQDTSGYVRIRQDTSGYIRQHTSAYVSYITY